MAIAPQQGSELFATKPVDALVADTEDSEHQLRRAVGALDLTALGLGAIIGTGIFVVIGEAITDAGPAIILSFVLAGVTCAFSALCFAELASTIRSPAARTRTPTPRWASWSRGSSAGT
jgi:basic amino acid/polyamine antiporter, APA family